MQTPDRRINNKSSKVAFLMIQGGGTGRNAALQFRQFAPRGEASTFPHYLMSIDTDQSDGAHDPNDRRTSLLDAVDAHVDVALTRDDVSRITANPERYGRVASELVKKRSHLLEPEALEHGSRTTRMITQLAAICHRRRIFDALEVACSRLASTGASQSIQPIVTASGGGGCGSSLLTMMTLYLTDPKCKQTFAPNFADRLRKPILLVGEPYAFASANKDDDRQRILANAFATRLEISLLSRMQRVFLALRLGPGNDHGTRLDQLSDLYAALGATTFMLASEFDYLTARGVDTFLKDMHTRRYNAGDVPEVYFSPGPMPAYAATPPRQRPQPDIPHINLTFEHAPGMLPSRGVYPQDFRNGHAM